MHATTTWLLAAISSIGLTMIPTTVVHAHEEGAPFSGAIIDPLEVHHAHIEDEQRVNLFFRDNVPPEPEEAEEGAKPRDVFMNSYELAWGSKDFRWGSEVFIPFSTEGQNDGEAVYGLGDIEWQAIKYAWINKPETIVTTAMAIVMPTGSEHKELGGGDTLLEPHFFVDQAYRNWYLGLNLVPSVSVGGDSQTTLEWGTVLSYSFINGTDRVAPPKPSQPFVLATSLEVVGETGLGGKAKDEDIVSLLPGLNLWHTKSGWQCRVGMRIPVTNDREETKMFLVQCGNHLDWGKLFGRR